MMKFDIQPFAYCICKIETHDIPTISISNMYLKSYNVHIFLPRVSEKSQNFWCVFVKIENSTFALYTAASYVPTTINEK